MGINKSRASISTEVTMACVAFLVLTLTLLLFISKNNYPDFTFSLTALEHSKISAAEASPCISNFTVASAATPSLRASDASRLRGVVDVLVDDHDAVDHDAKSFEGSLDDDDEHGVVGKLLISALRDATARAAAGASELDSRITDAEVEAWRRKHPCRSRGELELKYKRRKFVKYLAPNSLWQRVFTEYEKLHRTCMRKLLGGSSSSDGQEEDNKFIFSGNFSSVKDSGCKFVVADAQDFGLGNRLHAVASTFVYAVLTQRVILVPDKIVVPDIVCEPFVGSSWRIEGDSVREKELWTSSDQVWATMKNGTIAEEDAVSMIAVRVDNEKWRPEDRFWCDAEQELLEKQATWLYFQGCFYTVPKMFAVPRFRPMLEKLFPDRRVLTHVLHSLLLPADVVWNRVKQVDNVFLKHADRRVGIQLRYREGPKQFDKDHEMVNWRVLRCAIDNGILPQPYQISSAAATTNSTQEETIMVLTTSLFRSAHDFLTQLYVRHPPGDENTHAAVGVLQLTYEGGQSSGLEEDTQALTEMILLSFSDHLLVTPYSTFGSIAQSYGALRPLLIDVRPESDLACERAKSAEVCWQFATTIVDCPSEPRENGKLLWDVVPYVSSCSSLEGVYEGVQLLNPEFS